jgi:glycosyltransferase involved in cell wall biosynthesis
MINLSVIIPCKNEERYIAICLDALLYQKIHNPTIEIILVDNGSTDRTLEGLQKYISQISLLHVPDVHISELRNHGVAHARGEWVAFIDADVEVANNWYSNLTQALDRMERADVDTSKIVIGSTYTIPNNATWIERVWFEQLLARDSESDRYINGGNLIVKKSFFSEISGFDSHYATGEDVKFCLDAKIHGGRIIKDKEIVAVHHGYPKTIKQFVARERWHGLGMKHYFTRPWLSKDLLLALYNLFLLMIFLFGVLLCKKSIVLSISILLLMFAPLFILALRRSAGRFLNVFPLTFLYFLYGWARVFSVLDIISNHALIRKKS